MSVSLLRQISPARLARTVRHAHVGRPIANNLPSVFRQFDEMMRPFESFFGPGPTQLRTPFMQPSFGMVDVAENEVRLVVLCPC